MDASHRDSESLARRLATAGLHVFFTREPEVSLRLSREFFFDVVVVDAAMQDLDPRSLAEELARDGHRCVVLSGDAETWPPLQGRWGRGIEGALRRPIAVERLALMAQRLAATGDVEAFKRGLDAVGEDPSRFG